MRITNKHTPGPWRVVEEMSRYRVDAADGGICVPCFGRDTRAIDEANARLIAKAPELLECLRTAYAIAPNDMQQTVWGHKTRELLAEIGIREP